MDGAMAAAAGLNGALAAAMAAFGFAGGSLSRLGNGSVLPNSSASFEVGHCATPIDCCGCQRRVSPGELQISYRRSLSRPMHFCNALCLTTIPDVAASMATAMGSDAQVQFAPSVSMDERAGIEAALGALANQPAEAGLLDHILPFRAPRQRRGSSNSSLQRQLLQTDRDFTAEDYEMLLQLDEAQSSNRRAKKQHRAEAEAVLSMLPSSAVTGASAGTECMVCLEPMEEGAEVRTLPCMHFFHRKCIDRWFAEPGRPPRCPIDQTKVELTAG